MMMPLERPVLSLTLDAVVEMTGEDALCGLLTLFHKCKEGLQDGDRLENMAWRLWHVERISSQPCLSALTSSGLVASPLTSSSSSSSDDESDVSSDGEALDQDHQSTTLRVDSSANSNAPVISNSLSPTTAAPHGRQTVKRQKLDRRSPSPTSASSRSRSRGRRPSLLPRRTHSNTSVGQIMVDLLPEKLELTRTPSLNALTEQHQWHETVLAPSNGKGGVPSVVVNTEIPMEQPQPSPPPYSSPQVDRSMRFPTVVIVNPTPHPTPPMTPQVSPPPNSPPTISSTGPTYKRDTLTVITHVRSSASPTMPPTPESVGQKQRTDDLPSVPDVKRNLLPPATGPKFSSGGSKSSSDGGQSTSVTGSGKDNGLNMISSNVSKLVTIAPSGAASSSLLTPAERRFYIAQAGSPDCDSPDTSNSSQVGSHSAFSVSVTTSSALDRRAEEVAAACEPASVASCASASTVRSHSSNGSSSRSAARMKKLKGKGPAVPSSSAKGKGKETRLPTVLRTHSSGKLHRHGGSAAGGTIVRTKLGGRTAAANPASLVQSQFGQPQLSIRSQHASPSNKASGKTLLQPPPPAPVSKVIKSEKPSTSSPRAGSSAKPSSSSQRSSKSGTSVKSAKATKAAAQGLPSSSLRQRRLEFADDSDYSTETEWDTEDGSDDVETSGENEKVVEERKLAEAAEEAQRQRELFAKVDRQSYSDLTRVRTQPGLLSTIFHPDPQLFPEDHPYRQSRSTQDILAHTTPRPTHQAPSLQPSKSTTAMPVAATVTAQGVGSPNVSNGRQRSPLRLRGRPQDVEESDSGGEDENKIHISESAAEKRLALLQRQNAKGARPQQPSKLSQQVPAPLQPQLTQQPAVAGPSVAHQQSGPGAGPSPLSRVASEPIPLGYTYPYNLPAPMPPSTPRTTRRNMLTHELSESLRRNLLWERQVSKQRPMGLGRRAVTNAAAAPVAGPSNSGPSTSTTAEPNANVDGVPTAGPSANGAEGAQSAANGEKTEEEERNEKLIARNRSWADDYHTRGW